MRKAAPGCGGRKFQIIAALLTYSAVSLSAVPEAIHTWSQQKTEAASDANSSTASADPASHHEPSGAGTAILLLLAIGLASPFLELTSGNVLNGALGLFLVFIAVRYAWRTMAARDLDLHGPFALDGTTSSSRLNRCRP